MRELHTAADCGHYGIFSGRRWRQQICPKISSFIRAHA
jgi:poly(3-hydroxybutyrate) depolymerase